MQITKKDLEDFIREQPDDRPINMMQNTKYHNCGCLAIQYMRAKHPEIAIRCALTKTLINDLNVIAYSEVPFDTWCSWEFEGTYKTLKERL